MKRLLTLLLACTALVAAGCGGDEEEDPAPAAGGAAETTEDQAASPTNAGEVLITMKNFQFAPKTADITVGQTVKWTNEDSAPHNAVDEKGGAFKSELFNKGETYEFTAKKAGKIDYVCTIHPGMVGTLNVKE